MELLSLEKEKQSHAGCHVVPPTPKPLFWQQLLLTESTLNPLSQLNLVNDFTGCNPLHTYR